MLKQFYEKALPSQGVYCAAGIDQKGEITQRFAENLSDLFIKVQKLKDRNLNVYVAPGSFLDYSRLAANSVFLRSFFLDLDVARDSDDEKKRARKYSSKEEALQALDKFVNDVGLPPPTRVDSGGGIQAYWIFDQDVPSVEWKAYAEKFKGLCVSTLKCDPTVIADPARIMRCPDTLNYKSDPPQPTKLIDEDINVYDFEEFKNFLGVVDTSLEAILASIPKGLDEDTRQITQKFDDSEFGLIATKSLNGTGCAQIKFMLENPNAVSYDLCCTDGEEAIHLMSEDYAGYDRETTIAKARDTIDPHRCTTFETHNPGGCNGCPFRGKITNPLPIGRVIKAAPPAAPESVWTTPTAKAVPAFPAQLKPFFRAEKGGIYYLPPAGVDDKGKPEQKDPIQLCQHDIFPIKRMYSPADGECLLMRNVLPNDPQREFVLPMKHVYSPDKFKEVMSSNGILFHPLVTAHFMSYIIKWGQYLINADCAEQMRMQMGWVEDKSAFVIGNFEIDKHGDTRQAPSSPFVRGIAKLLKPVGDYSLWQAAANSLNEPGFEMHAFSMMCGFGSTIMHMTSTSGVAISLTGKSGNAKTGALYAALSIFGNPKELSVFDATDNGMVGRYLGLHNLLLGCDEVSNKRADVLSQLIHRVSHGKAKIRMQSSVNAERELELSASLIAIFTTNQSLYDKLTTLKANPDGEVARLVEFTVGKPAPLSKDPRRGKEIFDVFRTNYGYAGPEFVKHLFSVGEERIRTLVTRWSERFAADFGPDVAYRFYENLIAATFAAGELAVEAGVIQLDIERIYRHVVLEMISIRDDTVKVNYTDYKGLIGEFLNKHHSGMLILDGDRVTSEPRMELVCRIEVHTGMQYVSKTVFRRYLNELQISSREFEFAARAENVLTFVGKQRLSNGWKAGMSTPPLAVYGFKTDIPEEILLAAAQ
jgi:hypothetical protein